MSLDAVARETGARLAALDASGLNAMLAWSEAALLAEARRAATTAPDAPLRGMPIAIKDNIVTTELPTTCGSKLLAGYTSPFNATVIDRLRGAGALMAGKTNLDEFAMGSSTEHSGFGRVRHPSDPDRVPGGSSGGSAALVAAGAVPAALGSETGGSVRQPAAFCGVVGVKPTYGRVSRFGLVAFGSSLDAISVLAVDVETAARVLEVIAGPDPLDATCAGNWGLGTGNPGSAQGGDSRPGADTPSPQSPVPSSHSLSGLTIGLPREYLPPDLDGGVRAAVDRAAAQCRELGATIKDVSLPHTSFAVPTYYIVAPAEAAANLARFDGVRYGRREVGPGGDIRALYRATRGHGFGPEVRRRILVGTYVLSAGYYDAYYGRAQAARALIAADFRTVFASGVDLLLTPTTPTPAFKAGEKVGDPVSMYLADIFVCPANLAGVPAMSLPAGLSGGLPVGVQLIAPHFEEPRMLAAAMALERRLDATSEVR